MGKQLSGAQKRKKKREKEELAAEMERLKLGPTPIWTGLVLHHKDVFVSHVLPKLNETDRCFFSFVNLESRGVLAYAGVNVSKLRYNIHESTSISMLELVWNHTDWGEKFESGRVRDQAWFCEQVAATNKLEFLKWAREEKDCEWDEWTINTAACKEESCKRAAVNGHLDCVRFLFDKVEPSRKTEVEAAGLATGAGHVEILKYIVEERKISDVAKFACAGNAAWNGQLDCLKYLVEEAKVPLDNTRYVSFARYKEHHDCLNYVREKGCPELTDEEYARFAKSQRE